MHPKLLYFRYKLFRYRHIEQEIAKHRYKMLDIGCGDGENMLRFDNLPLHRTGIEVSFPRLKAALKHHLDVAQAGGEHLPFPDNSFDFVYIGHVLHHTQDYAQVLDEIKRVLQPEGSIFVVETVTDHPILRLARRLHPVWQGDQVEAEWRFADLQAIFAEQGLDIVQNGRYNVFFFLWEMLPLAFWPFEIFTPIFIYLDLFLARFFQQFSAHCYFELRFAKTE